MLNPDDKRDTVEQLNDSAKSSESSNMFDSYRSDTKFNDKLSQEKEELTKIREFQIIQGEEMVKRVLDHITTNCKSGLLLYGTKNLLSVILEISSYRESFTVLKNNNVNIKLLTEITADNLEYCKQFMKDFDAEIRNLKEIRGNFAVSSEFYIAINKLEEKKPIIELIRSNSKDVVEQNLYIFDTLWKNAIPLGQKMQQIEENLSLPEPYSIENTTNILNYVIDLIHNVKAGLSSRTSQGYFKVLDQNEKLFHAYSKLLSKHKEGKVKTGIRWVTHLEHKKEDLDLIKKFLDMGIKIRHTNNLPPLNFLLSEIQFASTVENGDNKKMFEKLLHTAEPLYIEHFQTIFEELWKNSIDAHERIDQIEKGIGSETTKLIDNPSQTKMLLLNTIENAKQEILMIFPSINAVKRKNNMGVVDMIKQKSQKDVKVKVLSPIDSEVKKVLMYLSDDINNRDSPYIVREIAKQKDFKRTILLVDRKYFLAIEPRDDSKDAFEQATAVSTYSTSQPTVHSYISIFETLWEQTEMANNLRTTNEKLIESEETEREFINVAAHELRTPTQVITGYSEINDEIFKILLNDENVTKQVELKQILDSLHNHHVSISRNAERLDNLINNLLDVARIDSGQKNMIILHKKEFDLISEIKDIVKNQLNQKFKVKNIKISFANDALDETCCIYADKSRLDQILINLLENAIKFSASDGSIDIKVQENTFEIIKKGENTRTNNSSENLESTSVDKKDKREIYISVSDSGKGISSIILPRLFQKFFTDSNYGTGLGLYITKKLVEAMGGRIWAFNNNDGIGSTFVFSLPLAGAK